MLKYKTKIGLLLLGIITLLSFLFLVKNQLSTTSQLVIKTETLELSNINELDRYPDVKEFLKLSSNYVQYKKMVQLAKASSSTALPEQVKAQIMRKYNLVNKKDLIHVSIDRDSNNKIINVTIQFPSKEGDLQLGPSFKYIK